MNYVNLKRYIKRWLLASPNAETAILLLLTAAHAVAEETGHLAVAKALRSFRLGEE